MSWRTSPTRVAWVILLASFFTCLTLAVAVPVGIRSFLLHATRSQTAFVTATSGTGQLWLPGKADPVAVTDRDRRPVTEQSRVATDSKASALLSFSTDEAGAHVDAFVQLFPGSDLTVDRARTPRFDLSSDPNLITLALQGGRAYLTAEAGDTRPVRVLVTTPHASLSFETGTFDILVDATETQVRTRSGHAEVLSAGRAVEANSGERVTVAAGQMPELPVPDTINLVLNGRFEGRLSPPWQDYVTVGGADVEPGKVTQEQEGGRDAVRFTRRTEDGAPNEVGLQQEINRDVQGYDSLVLRLDLQLLNQSVPGGGYQASEYPLMVRIDYTDIYNKDQFWVQGFYFRDLTQSLTWADPKTRGTRVPGGVWYTYESPNLFQLLSDTRPAYVNKLTVFAAGHDYDSRVADLALTVR